MHGATIKKDTPCTCNLTLWRVLVTPVGMDEQQCLVRITELHVTVTSIKILSFSQQVFMAHLCLRLQYRVLMWPCKVPCTYVAM